MSFKTIIDELITAYKAELNAYENNFQRWENRKKAEEFTAVFVAQKQEELTTAMKASDIGFNKLFRTRLHEFVKESIEEIKSKSLNDGATFQTTLSNALTFINLLGDKLTDREALGISQPFFGDFATMNRLFSVLVSKPNLNVTLAALGGYTHLINMLTNIEMICGSVIIFDYRNNLLMPVAAEYIKDLIEKFEQTLERLNIVYLASESDLDAVIENWRKFNIDTTPKTLAELGYTL